MNILVGYFLSGGLIALISGLLARQLSQSWLRVAIVTLGMTLAVSVVCYPFARPWLDQLRAPEDAEILQLIYGPETPILIGPDGETPYIIEALSETEREQFSYAVQVETNVVAKLAGWDHDPDAYLVLTRTGPPDCCDRSHLPILGGAILVREADTWQLAAYQKLITPFGSFNPFSASALTPIGPEKTSLVLPDQRIQNGASRTWDLLIAEVGGHLQVVTQIETRADNAAACSSGADDVPCWAYSATYEFVRGAHPIFDDLYVTTVGTRLEGAEVVAFEELVHFALVDGRYQPVGGIEPNLGSVSQVCGKLIAGKF